MEDKVKDKEIRVIVKELDGSTTTLRYVKNTDGTITKTSENVMPTIDEQNAELIRMREEFKLMQEHSDKLLKELKSHPIDVEWFTLDEYNSRRNEINNTQNKQSQND